MVGVPGVKAHQELYHNIEMDLSMFERTRTVGVSFTIHAPELLMDPSQAARAMYDSRWLKSRGDGELKRLVSLARVHLADRFTLSFEEGAPLDLAGETTFGNLDELRNGEERGLSPACIQAWLELKVPPGAHALHVKHSAHSEKRLMLVVQRPNDFPGAIDVEPGSAARVELSSRAAGQDQRDPSGLQGTGRTRPTFRVILLGIIGGAIGVLLGRLLISPKRRRNPH